MDKEYLRELAEEGAAIHSDPQPEREVCDGLLWALDEIERLRAALAKIADWDSNWGPFPENNEAWRAMVVVTAREAVPELGPNVL